MTGLLYMLGLKKLEQIIEVYPDADLFCVIDNLNEKDRHLGSNSAIKAALY